jgi:uncharacterized protein YbjT (DUF2867 family)
MNVFVTGATGFVGNEIVQRLREEGHRIRILVRNPEASQAQKAVSQYSAELHRGDIMQPDSLAPGLKGMDAVVHLVGIISEAGASTFENIHTRGTLNMVDAAEKVGVKRFIHMSALGTRADAVSRYHKSKWAAEELVRSSRLHHTIFRPSLIYGPKDHFVNLFAKISRLSPVVPVIGNRHSRFQPVGVEMVARAFVAALSEPRAVGQTYDLCGPERFTLGEMIDQILATLGRKRLKVQVPPALARGQAAFLELLFQRLLRQPPPLNRDQLLMLQEDNIGDPAPANDLFGLEQKGFREGIERYL